MGLSVRLRPARPRVSTSTGALGYDAFISYSHAVDRRLAPELQRALHQLAKPWYRTRALRVFRDDASLSANPHLWQSIQDALDASRFFILLASPESARSPWVEREIQYWLAHKPLSNLLIVLTDGMIAWNVTAGDFDWDQTTALPSSLRGVFDQEPRWVDFAWAQAQEHLSPRDPRFRDGVADIAAPLHGRDKDELFGEDVRQHRRTIRLTRAAIASLAALTLAASGTAVVAVNARNLARTRQRAAELNQRIATAHGLVAQADNIRDSDPHTALQLGVAAQRIHSDGTTQASLVNTLTTTHYAGTLTGHSDSVFSVTFSPDKRTMATGSGDHTVILWDLSDPARPRRLGQPLTGHSDSVTEAAFSPDGRTLAAASADSTVIFWDVSDPARPRDLGQLITNTNSLTAVAFSPNGRTLATGSNDSTAILWDVSDPARPRLLRRLGQPLTNDTDAVYSVAFSHDGRTLTVGGRDNTVTLWDVLDPARPRRLSQPLTGHSNSVFSVAFSPDKRTLATGSADRTVILWDLSDPVRPRRLGQPLTGYRDSVNTVAFSPDGRTLATGSSDTTVVLWDLLDSARPRRLGQALSGKSSALGSGSLTSDWHTLATGSADRTVLLWDLSDLASPRPLGQPLTGHSSPVVSLAFSPNGLTLATTSKDDTVILWSLTNLDQLRRQAPERACSLIQHGFDRDEWTRYVPGLPYRNTCPN